ncbi:O-antigen ligase domain-containing protein, partial [Methylobacterium sp. WL122]
ALVAAAAAIAFVEHNTWAAWWTAGLGAAITWLRDARSRTTPHTLSRPEAGPDRTLS